MIWRAALPDPRIVFLQPDLLSKYYCTRVWSDKAVDAYFSYATKRVPTFFNFNAAEAPPNVFMGLDYGPKQKCKGFRSRCTPPTLLFVCHESFEVASYHYKKAFGTEHAFPETWFDFERDTLYFGWDDRDLAQEPHDFLMEEAQKVQHLALYDHRQGWTSLSDDGAKVKMAALSSVFGNLSNFIFVVRQMHGRIDGVELVFTPAQRDLTLMHLIYETESRRGGSGILAAARRMEREISNRAVSFHT
jgi:hypothetical protein